MLFQLCNLKFVVARVKYSVNSGYHYNVIITHLFRDWQAEVQYQHHSRIPSAFALNNWLSMEISLHI